MMELSQNIPTIKRWTFEEAKKYAENKYRERYLNHEFSTKVISPYEYEDLIQNDKILGGHSAKREKTYMQKGLEPITRL